MKPISFTTKLQITDDGEMYGVLARETSAKLSSRGSVMVHGTLDQCEFQAVLEPDGKLSHWFGIDYAIAKKLDLNIGDDVEVTISPTKQWMEPDVPTTIKKALAADQVAKKQWDDITPMARWEWLRWVESVKTDEARQARPDRLCSMLRSGKRRPCCFNRAMRTLPKSIVLL